MLREIEWGVQNWPFTKNGFTTKTFIFLKFQFQCKSLLQLVDLMYQQPEYPNPYWGCFFPVSILKYLYKGLVNGEYCNFEETKNWQLLII